MINGGLTALPGYQGSEPGFHRDLTFPRQYIDSLERQYFASFLWVTICWEICREPVIIYKVIDTDMSIWRYIGWWYDGWSIYQYGTRDHDASWIWSQLKGEARHLFELWMLPCLIRLLTTSLVHRGTELREEKNKTYSALHVLIHILVN